MGNTLFTNVRIFDGTRRASLSRGSAGPGQPHQACRPRQPHRAGQWPYGHRRRRGDADAGHDRGPYPFLLEQRRLAGCDLPHAAGGAHAARRDQCQDVSRHGLHLLRRRRGGQAAPRRGDPQRHQQRPDPGPALSRQQPGDRHPRRARRYQPAAMSMCASSASAGSSRGRRRCARPCACSSNTAST